MLRPLQCAACHQQPQAMLICKCRLPSVPEEFENSMDEEGLAQPPSHAHGLPFGAQGAATGAVAACRDDVCQSWCCSKRALFVACLSVAGLFGIASCTYASLHLFKPLSLHDVSKLLVCDYLVL